MMLTLIEDLSVYQPISKAYMGCVRLLAVYHGRKQGLTKSFSRCATGIANPYSRSREYIVPSVAGPITTSLSALEYFTEAVLAGEPWLLDPVTIPLPWRHELAAKPVQPLRIGYYYDDGAVRVQPPHEFAVRKVVKALSSAGHEGELNRSTCFSAATDNIFSVRMGHERP